MENMELAKVLERVLKGGEWDIEACEELCKLTGLENEWNQAGGENFEKVASVATAIALNSLAPFAIELHSMPFDKNGIHATGREICTAYGVYETEYEDEEHDEVPTLFYENEKGEWGVVE